MTTKGYPYERRIGIRPELSGRIAIHFNGNLFAQFETNTNSSPVWMEIRLLGFQPRGVKSANLTWNNALPHFVAHGLLQAVRDGSFHGLRHGAHEPVLLLPL